MMKRGRIVRRSTWPTLLWIGATAANAQATRYKVVILHPIHMAHVRPNSGVSFSTGTLVVGSHYTHDPVDKSEADHALVWTRLAANAAIDIHPYRLLGPKATSDATGAFGS